MHKVYVLENKEDKSWYIGQTDDLERRIKQHNGGYGARTTGMNGRESWRLIYVEAYINKSDALGREKFLKGGSGRIYLKKQLKHYLGI